MEPKQSLFGIVSAISPAHLRKAMSCLFHRVWYSWQSSGNRCRPECQASLWHSSALWAILWLVFCCCPRARGLEPTTRISQYGHTTWRLGQAGLEGVPTAITQTSDGYIWIGTSNGLYRFDGVQFTRWSSPDGTQLPNQDIYSLLGAKNGSLYIGTGAGLARLTGGQLYLYPGKLFNIRPLVEDQQGTIWMGQRGDENGTHVLCKVEEAQIVCLGKKDGFDLIGGYSIFSDRPGSVWVGNYEGIDHWRQGALPETYPFIHSQMERTGNAYVTAFAMDEGGSLWAGVVSGGMGRGLLKFQQGKWSSYITPQVDGSKLPVRHLFAGKGGALWIGTTGNGIYKLYGDQLDHFDTTYGLSGDAINGFFQDREGNLWVLTDAGIDIFRDLSILTFSTREGLSDDSAQAVAIAANKDVWIGTRRGLNVIHGQRILDLSAGHGLPTDSVLNLYRDSRDAMWLLDQAGRVFVHRDNQFTSVSTEAGHFSYYVHDLTEDETHQIWATGFESKSILHAALLRLEGTHVAEAEIGPDTKGQGLSIAPHAGEGLWAGAARRSGLYWFHDGRFDPIASPAAASGISRLVADPDGGLWIFTVKHEIYRYQDGRTQRLTVQDGLPCDSGSQIVSDHKGFHWLFLSCGIAKISDQELKKWWQAPPYRLHAQVLTIRDGFRPGYSQVVLAPDGRFWSTNGRTAQVIDPTRLGTNLVPPPVQVEHLLVDHLEQTVTNDLVLQAAPKEIEIDYAGLSYAVPDRVKFRYRLEGYEFSWNEAGTRRQAFYGNLKPGHYTFRLIACNNDGVWNTTGTTFSFIVPPAWYQTIWFRLLSMASLVALVYLVYLLRLRQYSAAMRVAFNERLEERTRLARDLHDTLLQTIQAMKAVADLAKETVLQPDDAKAFATRISEWSERASFEGRAALDSLRDPASAATDLEAAFRRSYKSFSFSCPTKVNLSSAGKSREMNPIVRYEVYRIGSEAIRNACLHAKAKTLAIEIVYDEDLMVHIRDDGKGIESDILHDGKPGHYGLAGMRERALRIGAKLTITSSSQGTEVTLRIAGKNIYKR